MKEILAKEVENKLNELTVLDVREAAEVAEGKIPNALHIPLGLIEFRMNELDKNVEYTVVCRSGGRSSQAVCFLENQGFKAQNMTGGMLVWEGPTE
ncbi:rhodanese-like domain-containing protein [Bacillus sp. 1780r2a1]|nr:rhodanese-like domain-containing protein [Bacillus sp. 1780r2a1]